MEKIIKDILFDFSKKAEKKHEFEVNEDTEIIKGDLKALKKQLANYTIISDDIGIGAYDYGSTKNIDEKIEFSIEDGSASVVIKTPKNEKFKIKDLVESLIETAQIPATIQAKKSPEISKTFKLKTKNIKQKPGEYSFTLSYE